jgi:MoxR-like ATPase
VHDALKRRCLYFYIEHPSFEREVEIVRLRVPEAEEALARQVAAAVERLREMDLYKPPGVAETIDWTEALVALGARELDEALVRSTIGSVLKYREDQQRAASASLSALVGGMRGAGD